MTQNQCSNGVKLERLEHERAGARDRNARDHAPCQSDQAKPDVPNGLEEVAYHLRGEADAGG